MNNNRTSPHILSTSANLLGFCLFVITALRVSNRTTLTHIDEATSGIALVLALSSLLSFFSIRTPKEQLGKRLETAADYLFILALSGILLVILLIMLNYIN